MVELLPFENDIDHEQYRIEQEKRLKDLEDGVNSLRVDNDKPCYKCQFFQGYTGKNYGCEPYTEYKCLVEAYKDARVDYVHGGLAFHSGAYSKARDAESVRKHVCNGKYFIAKVGGSNE